MSGSWRFVKFASDDNGVVLPHAVHAWMKHAMLENLRERYANPAKGEPALVVEEVKTIDAFSIDLPGMVIINPPRPWEVFQFAGLNLSVPSEDVTPFHNELGAILADEEKYWRKVGGMSFTKLRAYYRILVLSRSQAVTLHKLLGERREEASKKAQVHFMMWQMMHPRTDTPPEAVQ